ncbi:MAG: hypothetical protein IPL61_09525 [Myxococcales bacterium]|nr:hypothetical protein [Myxococcales bacterium]
MKVDVDQLATGAQPAGASSRPAATTAESTSPRLISAPGARRRYFIVGAVIAVAVGALLVVVMSGGSEASSPRTAAATAGAAATNVPAEPPPPPPPQMPKRIVLRVERVRVATDGREWDGPIAETSYKKLCADVAGAVAVVQPEVAIAGLACNLLGSGKQRQTDPREPDLRVELRSGPVVYTSYVAPDRRAHQFNYSFVIPDESIPAQGLVLAVLDDDDGALGGEEIGSVRLSRDQLITMATTGELASLAAPPLSLLEVSATPHDGRLRKIEFDLAASAGGETARGITVNAGDIVRIEASGTWQIGTYNDKELGPAGFSDGRLQDYNLPLFPRTAHGSTVALVGQQGKLVVLPVQPCVRVVSPFAGVIWVGINDRKFTDNKGQRPHPDLYPRPQTRRVGEPECAAGVRLSSQGRYSSPRSASRPSPPG